MSEGFKKFDNLSMGIQATILLTDITMIGALVEKDGTLRNISVTIFILSFSLMLLALMYGAYHAKEEGATTKSKNIRSINRTIFNLFLFSTTSCVVGLIFVGLV